MEFVFVCGWCGEDCIVWGEPIVSWWTQKYRVDDFDCWNCGTTCTPPRPALDRGIAAPPDPKT